MFNFAILRNNCFYHNAKFNLTRHKEHIIDSANIYFVVNRTSFKQSSPYIIFISDKNCMIEPHGNN